MKQLSSLLMALLLLGMPVSPVTGYDIGCVYPAAMPEPFAAQYALAETRSLAAILAGVETPVVVYGAHQTTYCQSNCIAFHDDSALNVLTKARPAFSTPPRYHNSWSRMLCIAQCHVMLATSSLAPLVASWGFDPLAPSPDLLGCPRGHPTCTRDVVEAAEWDPRLIGQIVAFEIAGASANDGWNADGRLTWDADSEKAVPCTANCARFADITGYFPRNNPGGESSKEREYSVGNYKKYKVRGRDRLWQPIEEHDGRGYFSRQAHVTPHIGLTVTPILIESWKRAPKPRYDLRREGKLVVERLRELASSPAQKAKVSFFDNKLAVRGLIQQSVVAAFPENHTFEDHMTFISGISAAEYDALLQSWREKVRHDLVRPTTVIKRWGSDVLRTYNGSPDSTAAEDINARDFQPYIRVMPHSEYPSGSGCLCTAYAEFTDLYTEVRYGERLRSMSVGEWSLGCESGLNYGCDPSTQFEVANMTELQAVCGESRLWGGMHFTAAVSAAEELCSGIGALAMRFVDKVKAGSDWGSAHTKGAGRPVCPDSYSP